MNFIAFHSTLLTEKLLVKILTYALGVLLRRDMSLNRRIFQWFLNVNSDGAAVSKVEVVASRDENVEEDNASGSAREASAKSYFELYVREPLTVAMVTLFQNVLQSVDSTHQVNPQVSKHRQTHLKPFRILITLLDKPEVGSAILDDLMLEIFRTMYKHSQVKSKLADINMRTSSSGKDISTIHNELIKSANLLFSSLEPYFIWDYLCKVLRKCHIEKPACNTSPDADQLSKNSEALSNGYASLVDVRVPTYLEIFNLVSYLLDIVTVVCFYLLLTYGCLIKLDRKNVFLKDMFLNFT